MGIYDEIQKRRRAKRAGATVATAPKNQHNSFTSNKKGVAEALATTLLQGSHSSGSARVEYQGRFAASPAELENVEGLAARLGIVDLPRAFDLFLWAKIVNGDLFRSALISDLSPPRPHCRLRPAIGETRRLLELFEAPDRGCRDGSRNRNRPDGAGGETTQRDNGSSGGKIFS